MLKPDKEEAEGGRFIEEGGCSSLRSWPWLGWDVIIATGGEWTA